MMRPLMVQAPGAPTPRPCAATTPVTDESGLGDSPKSVELRAAPNPVRTAATLSFTLPTAAHVELRIYDVTGREVGVLADGTYEPGVHPVTWNARDGQGRSLASGIYFARLRAANAERTQRLVVAP